MGNIIFWIVFGGIAGAIAKAIMPGKNEPSGCLATIILGIVGSVVGGWIGQAVWGGDGVDGWNWGSYITAIIGTCLVLFIYGRFAGKK
jgi:uncharacterized membrane protein YeaQ/YmgE (transglycosylase-associated protein family)